jgi:rare lipoprotein A
MVTPKTPRPRRGLCIALCLVALLAPGVTFTQPSEEEGIATFYSSKSEGKKTASGEAYDKTGLTAAHKTYAYGTKLRVTNLANGKSAVVTVNDRMNRSAKSVIEVTPRVASSLGFAKVGHARVRVEVVK